MFGCLQISRAHGLLGGGVMLVMLSACASPQDRCVGDINRELRTVTQLIGDTELNLTRGYTYVSEVQNVRVGLTGCVGGGRYYGGGVRFCGTSEPRAVQRAVPIDPVEERRKLEALEERQTELADIATRAQSVCAARFSG